MSRLVDILATLPVVLLVALMLYMIAFASASVVAEKTCLEAGYPKAMVTYDFSVYCSNLDGNVTVKVDKQ